MRKLSTRRVKVVHMDRLALWRVCHVEEVQPYQNILASQNSDNVTENLVSLKLITREKS